VNRAKQLRRPHLGLANFAVPYLNEGIVLSDGLLQEDPRKVLMLS